MTYIAHVITDQPKSYILAVAWNWEFDGEFITGIERECAMRGISTYRIDPQNLPQVLREIESGVLGFNALYDRASDADPAFLELVRVLQDRGAYCINPNHRVVHAVDKATMHLELITHGLQVPYTIILPPFARTEEFEVGREDLQKLGRPFVIKPANTTGGGTGVELNAHTLEDISRTRRFHKDDKYLLQEMIVPKNFDGKRGWFRGYWVFDEIIPCWWDDRTHRYSVLTPEEETRFGLGGLRATMSAIQNICKLDFFSSEIAVTHDGRCVVVDYVNEVCDMRLQSRCANGAPDVIVHRIERLIAEQVGLHLGRQHQAGMSSTG